MLPCFDVKEIKNYLLSISRNVRQIIAVEVATKLRKSRLQRRINEPEDSQLVSCPNLETTGRLLMIGD